MAPRHLRPARCPHERVSKGYRCPSAQQSRQVLLQDAVRLSSAAYTVGCGRQGAASAPKTGLAAPGGPAAEKTFSFPLPPPQKRHYYSDSDSNCFYHYSYYSYCTYYVDIIARKRTAKRRTSPQAGGVIGPHFVPPTAHGSGHRTGRAAPPRWARPAPRRPGSGQSRTSR